MSNIFIYSHASKTLSQVASMEKPGANMQGLNREKFLAIVKEYNQHLASLKHFPCTGFSETDDGKEFGEGEFELTEQVLLSYGQGSAWYNVDEVDTTDWEDGIDTAKRRIIAAPLIKSENDWKMRAELLGEVLRKFCDCPESVIQNPEIILNFGKSPVSPETLARAKEVIEKDKEQQNKSQ